MDPSGSSKCKRGRKRQVDDGEHSQENELKREKNREAAKKCRQKKQEEATELKQKNTKLEKENRDLAEEKKILREKIDQYKEIIQTHLQKGCTLPQNIKDLWENTSAPTSDQDMENFRAVGTIESSCRFSTPPHTPESSMSENVTSPSRRSSDLSKNSHGTTQTVVGLFGGTELDLAPKDRSSRSSISSGSSAPTSPAIHSAQVKSSPQDLVYYLTSESVPKALAPIPKPSSSIVQVVEDQMSYSNPNSYITNSELTVPTVVSDIENEMYVKDEKMHWNPTNHVQVIQMTDILQKAFEQPDILSQDRDEVAKRIYFPQTSQLVETYQSSQNLSSTGFIISESLRPPEGYSYFEDLQREEPVDQIIKTVHTQNADTLYSNEPNKEQDMPAAKALAPALLTITSQTITPELKQQIHNMCNAPSSSLTESGVSHFMVKNGQKPTPNRASLQQQMQQHQHHQQKEVHQNVQQWINSSPSVTAEDVSETVQNDNNMLVEQVLKSGIQNPVIIQGFQHNQQGGMKIVIIKSPPQPSRNISPGQSPLAAGALVSPASGPLTTVLTAGLHKNSSSTPQHSLPGQRHSYLSRAASSTASTSYSSGVTMQTPTSCSAAAANNLPSGDFSTNVTNLPSLGFLDLTSESNIFEKEPSRKL